MCICIYTCTVCMSVCSSVCIHTEYTLFYIKYVFDLAGHVLKHIH